MLAFFMIRIIKKIKGELSEYPFSTMGRYRDHMLFT